MSVCDVCGEVRDRSLITISPCVAVCIECYALESPDYSLTLLRRILSVLERIEAKLEAKP